MQLTILPLGQDSDKIHTAVVDRIVQINDDSVDYDMVLIPEEKLREEFEGKTRIFGFFQNGVICKMTLISHDKLNIDSADYYFWDGNLFYISATSDQFIEGYQKFESLFFGRYYFRDGHLYDSIVVGQDRFKKKGLDPEITLFAETKRNLQLINDKSK